MNHNTHTRPQTICDSSNVQTLECYHPEFLVISSRKALKGFHHVVIAEKLLLDLLSRTPLLLCGLSVIMMLLVIARILEGGVDRSIPCLSPSNWKLTKMNNVSQLSTTDCTE